LERLGVKVAELEERIKVQEAATADLTDRVAANEAEIAQLSGQVSENTQGIAALWALTDNVRLSGKSETTYVQTAIHGPENIAHKDPRDKESDKWEVENSFESKLTLGINATPAENVNIEAQIILNDVFGGPDGVRPGVHLDVTTPGVLRMLHIGDLDEKHIAESFDKYTFDAKRVKDLFDDPNYPDPADPFKGPFQGADVHLVFGHEDSTELDGFITRVGDADIVYGAAASYQLSPEFNFTFRGVRDVVTPEATLGSPTPHNNAAVGVTVSGELSSADYSVTYVTNDDEDPGSVIDAWATFPLRLSNVRVQYASVDQDFNPTFARELDSKSDDWLDRKVDPPKDWVENGESDLAVTFDRPVLGVDFALTLGQRNDPAAVNDTNRYTQVEVGPFHFAGLDTSILYDRRVNDSDDVDNTLRATVGTTIMGADLSATVHNRSNDQVAVLAPAEVDQRSTWITASRDFEFLVPFTVNARHASNQALGETSTRLGVNAEREFGAVVLRAGYSTEQNALGAVDAKDEDIEKTWWKNATWSGNDKRDVASIGAEYTLKGFFGTDVNTGYEYRLVRVNDATYGTARNTFTVGFEKELRGGEGTLAGQGKYVTGGIPEEDGNETDVTAKLTLTYPVFEGANLKLGGEWVSSKGTKAPDEYSVYNVNAGLTIEF